MSLHVLSLNDHALTVGNDNGILARSQGSVVESGGDVLFGAEATARSRLYPVTFSNRFWHELGMEPLSRSIAHFRHHADMAHAHLLHLAQQAGLGPSDTVETVVLVPGTFSREQLRTLLGIMQHSPFRPVALVDAGVIAGAAVLEAPRGAHVDMHLHQMVVTGLQQDPEGIQQQRAVAVPGLGWHQLETSLAALVTDAFIRQARFNPQHDARWEQHLHDRLPEWLQQTPGEDDNLVMVLEEDGVRHQARLTRSALERRLQSLYRRLFESSALEAGPALVLAERCATLPGLRRSLREGLPGGEASGTVPDEQLLETGLSLSGQLRQGDGGPLRFIRSVDLPRRRARASSPEGATPGATHALSGHEAWSLAAYPFLCSADGGAVVPARQAPDGERLLGEIRVQDGHFSIHAGSGSLLLNGEPCAAVQPLRSGDRLHMSTDEKRTGESRTLQLIRVHDG